MTVPRGWTLDDLRDPDLHLFRPPERPDGPATRRNRTRRRSSDETGQLSLGDLSDSQIMDEPVTLEVGEPADTTESPHVDGESNDTKQADDTEDTSDIADAGEGDPAERSAALDWKPAFDDGDDLDGQLAARSPLLSRAFRGERG